MYRRLRNSGYVMTMACLLPCLSAPAHGQTAPSPSDQAAATYIAASQMQALNQNCKLLDEVDAKTLSFVVSDAVSGIAPEQLLKAEMQKNGAVAQVKSHPCTGHQADAAKARIRSELAPIGQLWAARARAFADLQAKTYPFLSAVKNSGMPGTASNIRTAADLLDKNHPTSAAFRAQQAKTEIDAAARVTCARLGGKSCPPPPAGSNADLALGFLGRVADYGGALNAVVVRVMASQAPRPAPPPPKPAEVLTVPKNPGDYARLAGLGESILSSRTCELGTFVAYVPKSQLPANLTGAQMIKAPVYRYGSKIKLGEVGLSKLGIDWAVLTIDEEARRNFVSGLQAIPCGY